METVERTPTEPSDYAALSAIYGALLAGTAVTARRTHSRGVGRTVTAVLAASAGNDLLQAAFSYLCAHADIERRAAESSTVGAVA